MKWDSLSVLHRSRILTQLSRQDRWTGQRLSARTVIFTDKYRLWDIPPNQLHIGKILEDLRE